MFKTIEKVFAAMLALACAGVATGADNGAHDGARCAGLVSAVSLTGSWKRTLHEGIVSYRREGSGQALTMAVYRLDPARTAERAQVLLKATELERELAHRFIGAGLQLSPVQRVADGGVLQTCYSGEQALTDRRFLSVHLAAGDFVQHLYYETAGASRADFSRSTAELFAFDPPPGRSRTASVLPPADFAALFRHAPMLPGMQGY